MIQITADEIKWYRHHEGEIIALALRDMAAGVLELEFEKEHLHERRNELLGCTDPRHAYTQANWQRTAHELLSGDKSDG